MVQTLHIELAASNDREQQIRLQLERLLTQYDLSPWRFTDRVIIQSGVIPHSHPVLTLNTRHLGADDLLLATYLHEQIHWFASARFDDVSAAMNEFRAIYPAVPTGFPEGGQDADSTYLHLVINWLEYSALQRVLGADAARRVIEHWCGDHYTWVYRQVLEHGDQIAAVLGRHGLIIQ